MRLPAKHAKDAKKIRSDDHACKRVLFIKRALCQPPHFSVFGFLSGYSEMCGNLLLFVPLYANPKMEDG